MSLRGLLNRPVEILPFMEGEVDEYNDAAPEFGDPVEVLGYFEQTTVNEFTGDRETSVTGGSLVLPAEAPIDYRDRVRIDEQVYEVDGTVNRVWNPRKQLVNHIEVRLKLVEG